MKLLILVGLLFAICCASQNTFAQTAGYLGSDYKVAAPYNPNHPNQLPSRKPLPTRPSIIQTIPNNLYYPQVIRVYPAPPIVTSPGGVIYYDRPAYLVY